jgi:hypothetical protein
MVAQAVRLRFSHKHFTFSIPIIPGILSSPAPSARPVGQLLCGVERLNSADRACAVAAAAAQDLNDELTIIVNSASELILTLEPGHPARLYLADIQSATQRCVWKVSGLLNYSARHGIRPVSTPMERLLSKSKIRLI